MKHVWGRGYDEMGCKKPLAACLVTDHWVASASGAGHGGGVNWLDAASGSALSLPNVTRAGPGAMLSTGAAPCPSTLPCVTLPCESSTATSQLFNVAWLA